MVLLTFTASLVVASAHEAVLARMRAVAPRVKRWGAVVLIGVGAWLLLLGVFAERFAAVYPV
jgi:hypothetical membrane protein